MTQPVDQFARDGASQAGRAGVIAVIGAPNAGKSTFVNLMVGAKVSIVTHKVQTTRARVRGVAIIDDAQLVFVDTPGIFRPRRRLDRAMVSAAWACVEGADAVIFLIDAPAFLAAEASGDASARRSREDAEAIIAALQDQGAKVIVALNKIDKIARRKLLSLIEAINQAAIAREIFLISAERGDGVDDLKAHLVGVMPEGPWLYPEDQLSDISDRLMAAEVTREKLFLRLHQEIPYETTVETEDWSRTKSGDIRLEQTIYVSRDSQKGVVLGKGGQTLKAIGAASREELAGLFGAPVHLFLHVKVRQGWSDEPARLRALGLGDLPERSL